MPGLWDRKSDHSSLGLESIRERLLPADLELEIERTCDGAECTALTTHMERIKLVIVEMEREVQKAAGFNSSAAVVARNCFFDDLLIVAGRLLQHGQIFTSHIALAATAVAAGKGGALDMIRRIIDQYDAHIAEEIDELESRAEASTKMRPGMERFSERLLRTADILIPVQEESPLHCGPVDQKSFNSRNRVVPEDPAVRNLREFLIGMVHGAFEAGALLPSYMPFGDRLHAAAVKALELVRSNNPDAYIELLSQYGPYCLRRSTYPGAGEIFSRAYVCCVGFMDFYVAAWRSKRDDPETMVSQLQKMLKIDAVAITYLHAEQAHQHDLSLVPTLAVANFTRHLEQFDKFDINRAGDSLRTLHDSYFGSAGEFRFTVSIAGITKLRALIEAQLNGGNGPAYAVCGENLDAGGIATDALHPARKSGNFPGQPYTPG